MPKPKRVTKKSGAKPSRPSSARLPIDAAEVEKLVQLAFKGSVVLVPSERPSAPAASPEARRAQIRRTFFDDLDLPQLEEDLEVMQEVQLLTSRRGDDYASAAVDRVVNLLESLLDTGETCKVSST
jgi:hypothetical protein